MINMSKILRPLRPGQYYEPERCWVGEEQKVCYATREEAEVAAGYAEHEYGAPKLSVYRCEYGDHYHLSSR